MLALIGEKKGTLHAENQNEGVKVQAEDEDAT